MLFDGQSSFNKRFADPKLVGLQRPDLETSLVTRVARFLSMPTSANLLQLRQRLKLFFSFFKLYLNLVADE